MKLESLNAPKIEMISDRKLNEKASADAFGKRHNVNFSTAANSSTTTTNHSRALEPPLKPSENNLGTPNGYLRPINKNVMKTGLVNNNY
jgi:hypothetical protein